MLNTPREIVDAARMYRAYTEEDRRAGIPDRILGPRRAKFHRDIQVCLTSGRINRRNVPLRVLFEEFVPDGRELLRWMQYERRSTGYTTVLTEEAGPGQAINTSAFGPIIGQITYTEVMQAMTGPQYIADQLFGTPEPASTEKIEMIPGITMVGDAAEDIGEGMPYPRVGVGANYTIIPEKIKTGFIAELTEEVLFEDKTGVLLERVESGGEGMKQNMEKEKLDVVVGITNTYNRNNKGTQNTYDNSGGTHALDGEDFDNIIANPLTGLWDAFDAVANQFETFNDPDTGEPIGIDRIDVVVSWALRAASNNMLRAMQVEKGARESAPNIVSVSPSPLDILTPQGSGPTIYSSPYVRRRSGSNTTWFAGDFQGAFGYREIWPIQVYRTGRESDAGFNRDVIVAIKVRRKGTPYVKEPRKVIKCT